MPSSLTLGCSRCMKPIAWRANPDVETTDWRARRGKTAHRVRREGTALAVPYPYPPARAAGAQRLLFGTRNLVAESRTRDRRAEEGAIVLRLSGSTSMSQ